MLVTGSQIRAARALLGWSAQVLADAAGVGIMTIHRFERENGIPKGQVRIFDQITNALIAGGVEFIGTPDDGPGVRLRNLSKD